MKKYTYTIILSITLFSMISCFKKNGIDTTFGAELVEFETTPTTTALRSYVKTINGLPTLDSVRINLVAPQRSTPVDVTYDVDTTALPGDDIKVKFGTAGVNYALVSNKTVTIPANSSFIYIKFNIIDDALVPADKFKLRLKIISSTLPIAENYRIMTIPFGVICPYVRANFLGQYKCDEPGYTIYDVTLGAMVGNLNGVTNPNFWDDTNSISINMILNGPNNSVSIPSQNVTSSGGVALTVLTNPGAAASASTINTCSSEIVTPYRINRTVGGALVENNVHTYRKP